MLLVYFISTFHLTSDVPSKYFHNFVWCHNSLSSCVTCQIMFNVNCMVTVWEAQVWHMWLHFQTMIKCSNWVKRSFCCVWVRPVILCSLQSIFKRMCSSTKWEMVSFGVVLVSGWEHVCILIVLVCHIYLINLLLFRLWAQSSSSSKLHPKEPGWLLA